jgi:hypothetical protein
MIRRILHLMPLLTCYLLWSKPSGAQLDSLAKPKRTNKVLNYNVSLAIGAGWGASELNDENGITGARLTAEISARKHHFFLEYWECSDLDVIVLFSPNFYSFNTFSVGYGYRIGWKKMFFVPRLSVGHLSKSFNKNVGGGDLFSGNTPPNYISLNRSTYLSTILGVAAYWQPKRMGVGFTIQENFNRFNNMLFCDLSMRFRLNKRYR